jgi:hypothetical protein
MAMTSRFSIVALTVLALFGIGTTAARADDQQPEKAANESRSGWDMALTGGFVASGLVDPVYALGNVTGQATRVVLRQTDHESSASLGVAMFAQLHHDHVAWIAPLSVGIGVRGDSHATFYLGSALRLGPHASVTGGVAIGSVATLPAGVVEGRPVTDTNFLSDLATRTTHSWFVGATYTFASLR